MMRMNDREHQGGIRSPRIIDWFIEIYQTNLYTEGKNYLVDVPTASDDRATMFRSLDATTIAKITEKEKKNDTKRHG